MAVNAHKVFAGTTSRKGYLDNLDLEKELEDGLRAVRDEVREALRAGFRQWSARFDRADLFEGAAQVDDTLVLRPKFRMQGSFVYRTCNEPAQSPPQEVDLDDGMFLPVSFLRVTNGRHPIVTSDGYFYAVESILTPLCAKRGWTLNRDKPSCVRIVLSDDAHIDLALYAIPDAEFVTLMEKSATASFLTHDQARTLQEGVVFAEDTYRALSDDEIMLAHREDGWKPSDPRKLEDWYQDALKEHGAQLRSISRYLKGWRDHVWEACSLSSIALMACVVRAYEESPLPPSTHEQRDDKALLMVAERLPDLLRDRILNPVVDGQFLDEGWSQPDRDTFISKARDLAASLRRAINSSTSEATTLAHLDKTFGGRIPQELEFVVVESASQGEIGAPAVLTSGMLKDIGQDPHVRDAVQKDGDGRFG